MAQWDSPCSSEDSADLLQTQTTATCQLLCQQNLAPLRIGSGLRTSSSCLTVRLLSPFSANSSGRKEVWRQGKQASPCLSELLRSGPHPRPLQGKAQGMCQEARVGGAAGHNPGLQPGPNQRLLEPWGVAASPSIPLLQHPQLGLPGPRGWAGGQVPTSSLS